MSDVHDAEHDSESAARNKSRKLQPSQPKLIDPTVKIDTSEALALRIRVSASDDSVLLASCGATALATLQTAVVDSVRRHIDKSAFVRLSFHKGSLLILAIVTAVKAIVTAGSVISLIRNDIENAVRKTLHRLKDVAVNLDYKKIARSMDIAADLFNAARRIINIFSSMFSPYPSWMNSDGWTSV